MKTAFALHKIIFIGSGNVATHLGKALYQKGYIVSQVYSPTKKSADALAAQLKSKAITNLKKLDLTADVYFIAIKDDAISDVVKQLTLIDKVVVHTSGSMPLAVLKTTSDNFGVFYPLQTFSKNKGIDFTNIPIFLEASNKKTFGLLQSVAEAISNKVQAITSEQRKYIHLSAVFACNFSNHMYAIAAGILSKQQLSFDILKPLIAETADKIQLNDPQKMQTGPAIRKDLKTMRMHLKLLEDDKELKMIYKLLSKHISH